MSNGALTLSPSRARRVAARALVAGALLVSGLGLTVGPAAAQSGDGVVQPAATVVKSRYVPGPAMRLADTTPPAPATPYGFSVVTTGDFGIPTTIRVDILHNPDNSPRAGLPDGTITTAVLSVGYIDTAGAGYVTVWPTGLSRPTTSNLNSDAAGRKIANLVHVRVPASGTIDIYRSTYGRLMVDLVGVYVESGSSASGRFEPIADATKARALDTRNSTPFTALETRTVSLSTTGVPANASAVVVNLTGVQAAAGYWTAYQTGGTQPLTSNLNLDTAGQTRAVQAIIPMNGTDKSFRIFSNKGGHLLVDVAGWYTGTGGSASTDGLYVANDTPVRSYDSRSAEGTRAPWGDTTIEFTPKCKASDNSMPVAAVAMNLTVTTPWDVGYVSAYPAEVSSFVDGVTKNPKSSNININAWPQTIANHAVTQVSTRGVALYTLGGAHLIADIAGCFLGAPLSPSMSKVASPNYSPSHVTRVIAPTAAGCETSGSVRHCYPGGINLPVAYTSAADLNAIADFGWAATWTDTSYLASLGNVMMFGHRTAHSGPFYFLHKMQVGQTYQLVGADGNYYNYKVMEVTVTTPNFQSVIGRSVGRGAITSQLVACSKSTGLPTSLYYRIVVTGRLYSVTPGA